MKEVKVGIIGFGTVGAGVAANILGNSDVIAKRANVKLVLSRIADLDITTDRGVKIPEGVLTTDAAEAIREADIVVELVGGTTVAKKFILDAIQAGKPVVTAQNAESFRQLVTDIVTDAAQLPEQTKGDTNGK